MGKGEKHQPGELGGAKSCWLPGEGDRPHKMPQGWSRAVVSPPQGGISRGAAQCCGEGSPQHHSVSIPKAERSSGSAPPWALWAPSFPSFPSPQSLDTWFHGARCFPITVPPDPN